MKYKHYLLGSFFFILIVVSFKKEARLDDKQYVVKKVAGQSQQPDYSASMHSSENADMSFPTSELKLNEPPTLEVAGLQLLAVSPQQQLAVLRDQRGDMHSVRVGDELLAGYGVTVKSVSSDRLVLLDTLSKETLWLSTSEDGRSSKVTRIAKKTIQVDAHKMIRRSLPGQKDL